jgi:peptide subunit release factor 1 (eRF1)
VILDKERARLFTIYLGTLEERRELRDYVPGKQATGGWYALAQDHYARHREKHVLRHVQHTIDALLTMFHAHPFDRLLVGGPDEAVALLKQHLPRSLRSRLAGTLRLEIFAGDAEVRDAVLRAADALEQEAELQEVQELLDAATAPFAVVGLDETLAVLGEGRVHRLMLADAFARSGRECMECNRLLAEGEHCPVCGRPLVAVADLGERVIARAREQGALVKVVTGGAGERLMQQDGLGAWLRY